MSGINVAIVTQVILKLLLTGIAFLVLSIICVLLIVLISKVFRVKRDREHIIRLTNRGNFLSNFFLSVTSSESNLRFSLSLNGVPLVPIHMAVEPPAGVSQPAAEQSRPNQAQKPAPAAQTNTGQPKPAINAGGALKSGQAAAGKVGALASFLGTLGDLIPGPLGSSLRARSANLTEKQGSALAAMQAPVTAGHNLDSLKQQSGQLANIKPTAAGQAPSMSAAAPQSTAVTTSNPITATPVPATPQPSLAAKKIAAAGDYVVQTQPLEPGAGYALVLKIGPQKNHYPEGTFGYTLKSMQQAVENLTGEPVAVVKQGVVSFPHIAAWRYWLAPALNILLFTILLFVCVFIFKIIWL